MALVSPTPRRAAPDQTLALWREYRRTNDRALRDRLVLTFAPLVKYIVYKKAREIPARCEVEDFISCGLEALIHSLDRFDPAKGATLEQYAWTRIHGAVLDELRRQDWAPRSVRRWERDIEKAADEFTGVEPAELRRRRSEIARSNMTSLNALVMSDDETTIERIDTLASTDERFDPEHTATTTEAKEKFRKAFATLPQREREIAVMLYVKNLTLAEIGEVLGVSESRVCQVHGEMKKKLRKALDADADILRLVA
ncbi:MAG: sigma-70 family RNA polymerase sigma factor [Actinobacteria bacterium]|nr:MAG: sigma-70 family RNA polymerase sigma factor [Actinomycetota bacterium]